MQQNLSDLLNQNPATVNSLIVAANEECDVVVSYLENWWLQSIGACQKKLFSVERGFDFAVVYDTVSEASLFGDANFVVIKFKTKPNSAQISELKQILTYASADNRILILCDKLERKDLGADWLQLSDFYLVLSASANEAKIFASYILKQSNLQIEPSALDLLISLNQSNFTQLYQDIQRMCLLYPSGTQVSYNKALEQLTDNAQYNVFALSNAYLNGDVSLAQKIFHNVCQDVEDAILLQWSLAEDLRRLIQIKHGLRTGSFQQVIAPLRIWGDAVNAFQKATQRISYQTLVRYYDDLAVIDRIVKGLVSGDALAKLEELIFNLCKEG